MNNPTTIFEQIDQKIDGFVNSTPNTRLRNGTGSFSTPFRGTVFGERNKAKIQQLLQSGNSVEVIWFGTNPNAPNSLEKIANPSLPSEYSRFKEQLSSGIISRPQDWDPTKAWPFYSKALDQTVGIDNVLFANFLPWGSSSLSAFIREVKQIDPDLLVRIAELCDEIGFTLITMLEPRFVIIPKGICRLPRNKGSLSFCRKQSVRKQVKFSGKGRTAFKYWVETRRHNNHTFKIICGPHSSYLPRTGSACLSKAHASLIAEM